MKHCVVALLLLNLAMLAGGAQAQLYKWVDEKGRTQYSEKPPSGAKSQELKMQAAPPPDQPAKAKSSKGPAPRTPAMAPGDGARLEGSWTTAPGVRVDVRFSVTDRGDNVVTIGQQWTIGGKSQVNTPTKYTVSGSGGSGTMSTEAPSPHTPDVPVRIGYRMAGDALTLNVGSGQYAGEHTLRRQ